MSYIVEVIRPIRKEEIVSLVRNDSELSIIAEGEKWVDVAWSRGDEQAVFNFAPGRISVTTPSEGAWEKTQALAQRLRAVVIGENSEPAGGKAEGFCWPLHMARAARALHRER